MATKTVYGEPIVRPARPQQVSLEFLAPEKLDMRIRKRQPVWVVNTAVPAATLGLSFTDLNGNRKKGYQIPKSILPFNVTNDISHAMLRDGGTDLRNMLSRGWVKLVTDRSAQAYLKTDKAKHEIDRLKRNKMMGTLTGDNIADYNLQPFMDAQANTDLRDIAEGRRDFSIKEEFVSSAIKDLVVRVEEKTTPVRDAMSELEIMGELGPDDLHYMMASSEGRLKQYASKKLEGFGAQVDNDGVTAQAGGHSLDSQSRLPEKSDGYSMFDDDGTETKEDRAQRARQRVRGEKAAEAAQRDFDSQRG